MIGGTCHNYIAVGILKCNKHKQNQKTKMLRSKIVPDPKSIANHINLYETAIEYLFIK